MKITKRLSVTNGGINRFGSEDWFYLLSPIFYYTNNAYSRNIGIGLAFICFEIGILFKYTKKV